MPIGPYRQVPLRNGRSAPFYMVPFDEDGLGVAPRTEEYLVDDARKGAYTHIYLFSHGWNTDFESALTKYGDFIQAFQSVTRRDGPLARSEYKPLLVGISWPSIDFQFPWEAGPTFQAANPDAQLPARDRFVRTEQEELQFIGRLLPPNRRAEFYRLSAIRAPMTEMEARSLANLLIPVYATNDDPMEPDGVPPSVDELVEFWRGTVMDAKTEALGSESPGPSGPSSMVLGLPDPRDVIRIATVWKMKDRAGKVGASGVRRLLRELLSAAPGAKVHLAGHSFGGKVVLSAAGFGEALPRQVNSILLLQPAVNCYCFAADADGKGLRGGYRPVLTRVEQPILATFSSHDLPLTKFFHLALRRKTDLAETGISKAGEAPSPYAALGGFGPQGSPQTEARQVDIKTIGDRYVLSGADAPRIYGIRGDAAIDGHGGVINQATAWALYCQVTA
jgi:pimeloyl-ACP methyl ester carboxylesterase